MMEKKENEILKVIVLFFLIVIGLYFIFPLAKIKDFASYLSGFSTVGIFVLTSFYVLYTNRQIKELQKQRELQIQPLPNIEIIKPEINHPCLVGYLYEDTDFFFRVDLSFKVKIKNIGNGAAILVDIFNDFIGTKINKIDQESILSKRINAFEVDKELTIDFGIRDVDLRMLKALHSTPQEGCAAHTAFDVLLRTNIFYRNVLNTPFLLKIDHIIMIDDENQKKITDWFSIMSSYESKYASEISKVKSVWQRDKKEAWDLFSNLANIVNDEFSDKTVSVQLLPYSSSFKVENLSESESEKLSKKIYHGIPMGRKEKNHKPDENEKKEDDDNLTNV